MIRRPPRSTLFPTRRSSDLFALDAKYQPVPLLAERAEALDGGRRYVIHLRNSVKFHNGKTLGAPDVELDAVRSEEHTSELQSQSNIVCRLLLVKIQTFIGQ